MRSKLVASILFALLIFTGSLARAGDGEDVNNLVLEHTAKLNNTELGGVLQAGGQFGSGIASLGDLDDDGSVEVIIGAHVDDEAGSDFGAFYVLSVSPDGSGVVHTKISQGINDNGVLSLEVGAELGFAAADLGDYDGDGYREIAVTGQRDGVPSDSGRVWILDLDTTTFTVQSGFYVGSGSTNFTTLGAADSFGWGAGSLGDWDDDGAPELAVGAPLDDDGRTDAGALYILYLDPLSTATAIKGYKKFSKTEEGAGWPFDPSDTTYFGSGVAAIGDLNGDGQIDLAVGARHRGPDGAVWILFMDPACAQGPGSCAVLSDPPLVEIAEGSGGLVGPLWGNGRFGNGIAWLESAAEFGVDRLAIGAFDSDSTKGVVWVVTLGSDGWVTSEELLKSGENGLGSITGRFGHKLASLGDLDGNGSADLIAGAITAASSTGVAHVMIIDPCPDFTVPRVFHSPGGQGHEACPVDPRSYEFIASGSDPFHLFLELGPTSSTTGTLCRPEPAGGEGDEICAWALRFVAEGELEIESFTPPLGASFDVTLLGGDPPSESGTPKTELRMLWSNPAAPATPASGPIELGILQLGGPVGGTGSLGLAPGSLAVGASLQPLSMSTTTVVPEPGHLVGLASGLALLLWLRRRRTRTSVASMLIPLWLALALAAPEPGFAAPAVRGTQKFGAGMNGFPTGQLTGGPDWTEWLFTAVAPLSGMRPEATYTLAVSSQRNGTYGNGRLWLLFMDEQSKVFGWEVIPGDGPGDRFGESLVDIGHRSPGAGGVLAVGVSEDEAGTEGSLTILRLESNGTTLKRTRIGQGLAGFGSGLDPGDSFGHGVADLGDLDGDGDFEIAVGAPKDDDIAADAGAVWVLFLDADDNVVQKFKITDPGPGNSSGPLLANDRFGFRLTGLGDLDGNGPSDVALAVSAIGDDANRLTDVNSGAVWILFLDYDPIGPSLSVLSHAKLARGTGGFPFVYNGDSNMSLGLSLAWLGSGIDGLGGTLVAGSKTAGGPGAYAMSIGTDGLYRSGFEMSAATNATVGTSFSINQYDNGTTVAALPDVPGIGIPRDERPDLLIADNHASGISPTNGGATILFIADEEHDGANDLLDNCPGIPNATQSDLDADGVGDLCDNCPDVANTSQADADSDGTGDACETVEIVLQTTGTPAAPSWDLFVRCGAFDVTRVAAGIVLPAGHTGTPALSLGTCSSPPPGEICANVDVGASSIWGPTPMTPPPAGARSDSVYFDVVGSNGTAPDNRLCNALDPPAKLGTLTTGPISGTQLAAAALTEEGLEPGVLGLDPARNAAGAIPLPEIRLVQGPPLPVIDLELGPAVDTLNGTRWEVCLDGSEEFHRVAFGLVAPVGTTAAGMRWLGCTTPGAGDERTCAGVTGFGPTVNAAKSWTVGPSSTPTGTLLDHTLYVVLEGNRFSSGAEPTLNFQGETVCLGSVELDTSPDLEPALTLDGINDVDDRFNTGNPVTPYQQVLYGPLDVTQVRLIGTFNPADDLDGDGIQDLADNCPFIANEGQVNRGSFLDPTDESDSLGDACQCAESTDDGAVLDPDDYDLIADYLQGRITNPLVAAEIEERCSVAGTTECNVRDLVMLGLALDGAISGVETRCDAALSPAKGN